MAGKSTPTKSQLTAWDLLQQIALERVLGNSEDPVSIRRTREGLGNLAKALERTSLQAEVSKALDAFGPEGSDQERETVATIADVLDRIQTALERDPWNAASVAARASEREAAPVAALASYNDTTSSSQPDSTPSSASLQLAARDPEMVELMADFVAESLDGLDRVEAILLAAEQGSSTESEQVNALFRVFHTIKGVSGFLSVAEVTRLAHVTEALLDLVRQGTLELSREAVDVLFESSNTMRSTLEVLRRTVPQGAPDPLNPLLPALIARIESVSSGRSSSEAERMSSTAAAAPGSDAPEPGDAASRGAEGRDAISSEPTEPTTAAAEPTPARAAQSDARGRETMKVDLERVDGIVEMVGELIIVESMVVNAPEILALSTAKLRNYLSQMSKISRDLQNAAMRMRMVPVSGVFRKMTRLVRDLSRKTGKLVLMEQTGETTEMDRSMVERIEDPLVHMIRNAIDHAIETPEERRALGKPAAATIRLSASYEGGSVAIDLTDDGRGLPREKILKKARERGLIPDSGETLSDEEVFSLIFIPGFSTANHVTEISGRGVGMDVVKRSVEDMRGRVIVDSERGRGTTFKLVLPLTLAIIDGMLVCTGDERYIIPSLSIVESLQPTRDMVHELGDGTELIHVRGEIFPLLRLGTVFGVTRPPPPAEETRCIILESAGHKLGLLVDDILAQQQVVIKPLGEGLGKAELLAGAAILPDGRVGLILNVDRLDGLSGRRRRATNDSGEVAA
jgi:two-component system, chemotaxis family, sensor kinase CheA